MASKFQTLTGGGDTSVTTHRVGHRTQTVDNEQAQKIVHVRNLPFFFSELDLIKLCDQLSISVDRIQYPVHMHGPLEGQPKGFAWLEFQSPEIAQGAISKLHNRTVHGTYTLFAEIFVPGRADDSKIRGFAHLKRKNQEHTDNTSTRVDGVPYNAFVKLLAELDGLTEDDMQPIFGLPGVMDPGAD